MGQITNCVLLFTVGLLQISWGNQDLPDSLAEKKRILDHLLENYDPSVRPHGINGTDGPVPVTVNALLRSITSISDYDMDFGIQVLLRQEWMDERLKFKDGIDDFKYLSITSTDKIWTPDLFIQNEKDSHLHKVMTPNVFIRIHPSGLILFSTRISLTLWCHMQLERFPFDTQVCSLKMASYGLTTEDQTLTWRTEEPVQVSSNLNIMGFTMKQFQTLNRLSTTNTGEYSSLKVNFYFKRDLKYYILHTFLPSTVLVVVSWASFLMDRRAVVARILLVLSTLFAMSSLTTDIEASVPHVPYVKSMDLWAGACFSFLLAALVEFAIVNAINPSEEEPPAREVKNEDGSTTVNMTPIANKCADSTQTESNVITENRDVSFYYKLIQRLPKDPRRIDCVARFLFPIAFLVFLIIYIFT